MTFSAFDEQARKKEFWKKKKMAIMGLGGIVSFLFICIFMFASISVIEPGKRGVEVRLGKVQGVLDEGMHFVTPFVTRVAEIPVRETKLTGNAICYSKDAQIVESRFSINVSPYVSEVANLYQNVGRDFIDKLALQVIEAGIKSIIGSYKAVDIITNRQKATDEIRILISTTLNDKHLNVHNFELTNIDFDDAFEKAVKDKVIAVEESKRSKNLLEKAKNDKAIVITGAQAEAESMRIRAKALQANRNLIEYEAIQRWDGKLPQYNMGQTMPFINVGSMK